VRTYKAIDGYNAGEVGSNERRTMDCIDCHNRPAHIYYPPFRMINDAMAHDRIPSTLPGIRSIASYALTRPYETIEQARTEISGFIRDQYSNRRPDIAQSRAADIDKAIGSIRGIYERNFFPEMKVDWRHYPTNIGHMYNEGCFRCHDNQHKTDDGRVLSNDCSLCHLIVAQGPPGAVRTDLRGMAFVHPADIDDAWQKDKCTSCHNGE
jgi:hypothetical protein